ncbi:MAG: InlB B-repeat-containing protein, partial [Bacilli bacterium]|nr:InlB B-repeat-containing protein [Bacilli bacterium]
MSKLKNKKYIILTGLILVTMLLVLVMKYGTTDKYKGLVKVRNIKVSEKILSSSGTIESENTSRGIDEVEYKVKYTLDELDGVTKRDVIIKGRTNSNYARFKGINKNNITSTLKENGKEIEVRVEDVPLGIEQELKLTLIIENAPNSTRIKPSIEISEATGEYTSILTNGIEVETNSLEGLVLDENNIRVGNIELSLKKDGREVKRTYTDEDGKYTFTDIEEGRYNVEVEEEIYESVSSEIEISESTVLNISVRKIEPYRIETHKYIERLNLVVNGEAKEYTYNDKEEVIETVKNAKTISGEIEYKIVVKNTGEKSGVITKIEDEPSSGLKFNEEENTGWEEKNKKIYYRPIEGSTLDANKTKEIKLVLEIENTEEIKTYINKLTTNGEIYEKVVYVLDGEIYKEEEVLEGELITPPSVPIENFDGWYTDINRTNKYKFSNPVRKDLILYGYTIEDIKYNVRYIDNEELYSSEEVKKNEYATKPSTDPSKTGYTFKYWSLDGENEYNFSTPVTEDIDLYSAYEINKYNVTFIDNNEEYNKQEISYNGNIIRPEDPSKEYYRFLYWSLEENGNPYDLNTPVTSNVTLYSVYEINRYRVKFIDQGNEISNELVDAGTLIQPIEVTKEGYTFKYWSEDNEHGYNFSTPVTKDVTLTSIYEINIYNVEFYHNDSLVKTLQIEYNNLIDQAEVPVVTKEGYTFTYWSLQNESEGYDFTTRVTKNIKLYSNFVKQRKAVIFNDENRITEVTVDWGDTVNPITDKGKTGYTFSHWSLNVGGTAFDFSTPILEPTTLYAVYTINTYNITYNLDGGSLDDGVSNPSTYTVETEDFTLNNPSKVGYNFIGWTGSNGNIPSTNVTVEKGTINDLTFTANYEVIEYTITYTLNGGTVTENPGTYTVETDTFTLNKPTKTGYTFTGWTGSNGETPEETVSIPKGSTGNRNYEAHYNINKYTVTYMNEGVEYSREEVNYHDTATKPSTDPSKEGYEFKYWSLEENGSAYNFNTEIENNITLYSVYEINKYEVTFMDGESQYSKVSNIEHGSKVTRPETSPSKAHNIFLYWTLNNEAYDFNTPVTSDITLYSKYEEVEKPTISHTPTEWTNNSVTVTITSSHNDYTYMYKIGNGSYQAYSEPFVVSDNCDITAYSVKTNISSVEEEHEIDNIDKINPLINYYEGEEITPTSIKIKIKIKDNESGIKLYKVYLDNTLLFTSNEYITNLNEEKTEEYTIGSLEQITTYNVKVEIEDKVG